MNHRKSILSEKSNGRVCYTMLSPSKCANRVAPLIQEATGCDDVVRADVGDLLRQMAQAIYEQCARVAQDWVAAHDQKEMLEGLRVGDAIAESIRQLGDDGGVVHMLEQARASAMLVDRDA